MNWKIVVQKGLLGVITFVVAYLAVNPSLVTNFIPSEYANMTVGSLAAGLLVAAANWLKNRNKK